MRTLTAYSPKGTEALWHVREGINRIYSAASTSAWVSVMPLFRARRRAERHGTCTGRHERRQTTSDSQSFDCNRCRWNGIPRSVFVFCATDDTSESFCYCFVFKLSIRILTFVCEYSYPSMLTTGTIIKSNFFSNCLLYRWRSVSW